MNKISFLFTSFPSENEITSGTLGQPNVALKVNKFPEEFSFLACVGLVNIDITKKYSISVNLFYNNELVTDPEVESPPINHKWSQSKEGHYASTFGIPLTAKASEPGVYVLKFAISERLDDQYILLDESQSQLIISQWWNT